MIRNHFIFTILFMTALSQTGCSADESLTLEIPKEGLKVVQHIPKDSLGRDQNALYLTPRRIAQNEFNSAELNTFIDTMYAIMLREEGVGIAANQLGKRLQISSERKNFWHGCLSADGEERGNVATFEWIEYECQNQKGEVQRGKLEGFASVIFQHEFRHLMNGTYLDHAKHFLTKDELDHKLETGEVPFFELANDTLPLLIEDYQLGKNLEDY